MPSLDGQLTRQGPEYSIEELAAELRALQQNLRDKDDDDEDVQDDAVDSGATSGYFSSQEPERSFAFTVIARVILSGTVSDVGASRGRRAQDGSDDDNGSTTAVQPRQALPTPRSRRRRRARRSGKGDRVLVLTAPMLQPT